MAGIRESKARSSIERHASLEDRRGVTSGDDPVRTIKAVERGSKLPVKVVAGGSGGNSAGYFASLSASSMRMRRSQGSLIFRKARTSRNPSTIKINLIIAEKLHQFVVGVIGILYVHRVSSGREE
jgi:hypothetical protein